MRDQVLSNRDQYLESLLKQESSAKLQAREFAKELNLLRISLSCAEAQLLFALIKTHGCKKAVEIGTLTGLSALYIWEALPEGGELWTLEKDPRHAEKAQQVFSSVDQSQKKINLVVGDAREQLPTLKTQGPFDLVFIDGNKAAYFDYLLWAEENLRSGGMILADNIFLSGAVWGEATEQKFSEKQIRVMREFNERLADPNRYDSAVVPTAEGLYLAIKKY